jgi:hypothetical protein
MHKVSKKMTSRERCRRCIQIRSKTKRIFPSTEAFKKLHSILERAYAQGRCSFSIDNTVTFHPVLPASCYVLSVRGRCARVILECDVPEENKQTSHEWEYYSKKELP